MIAIIHDTLIFDRRFHCAVGTLYAAFANAEARARWGLPSPTAVIIYDKADFRVGGTDSSRCGARNDPQFFVDATYLQIVEKRRIVHSETVRHGGQLLSAALHTLEFSGTDDGARLKVTVQLASFDGAQMADGVRFGFNAALENLALELADEARQPAK